MRNRARRAVAEAPYEPQAEVLRRMDLARRYNTWLLDRARPYLGARVLDAGAGTGTFTDLLSADHEVVAMEPEAAFADRLRARFDNRPSVTVLESQAGDLQLDSGVKPFDSIVCFNVLEHVPDDAAALGRFLDVLAPGGSLLLLVPAHPALFGSIDRTVGHVRRYRRTDLADLLTRTGFVVKDARYVNPVGAVGWFVAARVLKRTYMPEASLRIYDRFVPALRALDRLRLPVGLSVWAVASRPSELDRT